MQRRARRVSLLAIAALALAARAAQAVPCSSGDGSDSDADGICDADDNCPDMPNLWQQDFDLDHMGDACDCRPQEPNAYCIGNTLHHYDQPPRDCGKWVCKKGAGQCLTSWACGEGMGCGDECVPCSSVDDCERPLVCSLDGQCVPLEDALAFEEGCSTGAAPGGGAALGMLVAAAALSVARRRAQNR